MSESAVSVELLEELASTSSITQNENFQQNYERELKNWEEFKRSAPTQLLTKIEKFEKNAKQIDNTLCELLRNMRILFCVPQMILVKDPKILDFPATSIAVLQQFFNEEMIERTASTNTISVQRSETPYAQYCIAIANIAEHVLNSNLESYVYQYFNKLPYIEKVFVNYFQKFRGIWMSKVDEYKRQIFENTDYFRNLKNSNEISRKRLKEIETGYRHIVQDFIIKKHEYYERMDSFDYEKRVEKEFHEMELQSIRLKNVPFIEKIARNLSEDRASRAQMAENIEELYQRTLVKDLKRCKGLAETRYKREMAVVKMIEKFDRDFSVEYKHREQLNEHYQSLINKSHQLDDEITKIVKENYLILNLVENQKDALLKKIQVRQAKVIQRWWRKILNLRKAEIISEPHQSKSRHTMHRVQSSLRSKGISPQSSVRSAKHAENKSSRSPAKRKVRITQKPHVNKIEDISHLKQISTESLPDPLNPPSPDALKAEIDRKELVSIALKLKTRSSKKRSGKSKSPRKVGKS